MSAAKRITFYRSANTGTVQTLARVLSTRTRHLFAWRWGKKKHLCSQVTNVLHSMSVSASFQSDSRCQKEKDSRQTVWNVNARVPHGSATSSRSPTSSIVFFSSLCLLDELFIVSFQLPYIVFSPSVLSSFCSDCTRKTEVFATTKYDWENSDLLTST